MSAVDDALRRWLASADRNTVGPDPHHATPLIRACFRAGWDAAMRQNKARGEQTGLHLGLGPHGPAWTPVSGDVHTREQSVDAAGHVHRSGHAKRVRQLVLDEIRRRPDSDQGIAKRLGLPENTVRPRRVELQSRGLVAPGPTKRNDSGRSARVWVAVDLAREPGARG